MILNTPREGKPEPEPSIIHTFRTPEEEAQEEAKQKIFAKIIGKVMDNNEKINNGKETSVIEYMKRIDMKAKVLKSYENQKAMRTSFYEEFKIEGFKFITLLFESMIRFLATMLDH